MPPADKQIVKPSRSAIKIGNQQSEVSKSEIRDQERFDLANLSER
jgi:hypothetical protein